MTHAREADPSQFLQLHNVVEQIALAAGVPKPRVFVVHDPAPNVFATGKNPNHAVVAVTTGLLEKLERDELEGVIAHEVAHIRNYDIRVMTVAVATAGSIALITDMFWRMMYFGGMQRSRDRDRDRRRQQPAGTGGVSRRGGIRPPRRRVAQSGDQPAARGSRRRERSRIHARPNRSATGARKA